MNKKIRLFGNTSDLELTSKNSTCDFYRLSLYAMIDGNVEIFSKEAGFLWCSKKEIFKTLKAGIIADLARYGIAAR